MICFIDFETTGIDVFKDRPIEIGAILINEDLEITNTFHSLINPNFKRKFKASAKKIHGIENFNYLNREPLEDEVLNLFFNKMGTNYSFCSWNISFDVTFFRRMCHRNRRMRDFNKINYRHLDLQSIMKYFNDINNVVIEENSLDNNLNILNLKRPSIHSALEDAEFLLEIYKFIYKRCY
ncbi:3'-5' exonuclease [Sphingobacterium lactis]|uniref:Exonuclease n=1 Tax=Sphingobacterium lactis TaxID=797291 RepID=A0A1H5TX07_9SPHI|nr:3'-5' exonuclease [Sphingobacterium lactis]SEF67289.1 Exonuclease [Sphingobacterium lactis]